MRTIMDVVKNSGFTLWSVTPRSSVYNALKLMAEGRVGVLPVFQTGELVGIIDEKDCITKVILDGGSIKATRVLEIMTRNLIFASPNQTIEECINLMTKKDLQYLPVVTGTSFYGIVSINDLFKTMVDDQQDYIYRMDNYVLGIDYGK